MSAHNAQITKRLAETIDQRRRAQALSFRALERASGWSKQSLVVALRGGGVTLAAMDAMATVVGLRLVAEPIDDVLPLSLDQLRMITR